MTTEQSEYIPSQEIIDKMRLLTRQHQRKYEQQLKLQKLHSRTQALKQAPQGPKQMPVHVVKVGRNDPCSCGSGKKYKKCCGASDS